ncbi:adenylosuccinate lyase [Devosia pacifica]|uniref:Adenylosuccinate lyase n=1 Tax=Devosia pacifica TaxID=1335967 RepID=A0A918VY06_9HYPH|nr:adenylosuccinate lyase family protein [Devosia pacifica]GHA35528.1 adenylosuccinate lyase [Devosia pacifica]
MAHIIDHRFYKNSWGTPEMREVFDERQRFQRWLDIWAGLATVQAELGIVPQEAADEIVAKAKVENLDEDFIFEDLGRAGHTLVPVLRAFEKACGNGAGEWIHYGATTQDIQDTALSMEMRDAWAILLRNLLTLEKICLDKAKAYRDTTMVGRTHNQHGLPMTLGMKIASWAAEIRRDIERLKAMPERSFLLMMHGGVGTMAALGPQANEIVKRLGERFELTVPPVSWASARDGVAEFVSTLGIVAGTMGRIANEVYQLSRTEIGEMHEPMADTVVGSTTMPHKRNAVRSEFSGTMVRVVMNNVALALQSMIVTHERDASVWRLDWHTIPESSVMLDRVIGHMNTVIGGLAVNEARIAENLEMTQGAIMSEALMFRLSDALGKQSAHHVLHGVLMRAAETGTPYRQALQDAPELAGKFDDSEIAALLDYASYVGTAGDQVDATIAESERLSASDPAL